MSISTVNEKKKKNLIHTPSKQTKQLNIRRKKYIKNRKRTHNYGIISYVAITNVCEMRRLQKIRRKKKHLHDIPKNF